MPVLPWRAYSPDVSPIEHVWDALDLRVRHRVPVPANTQKLHTAIVEELDNMHCIRQMVVTSDTDWFSDPRPYFFLRYL